jgi:hypothetical protein
VTGYSDVVADRGAIWRRLGACELLKWSHDTAERSREARTLAAEAKERSRIARAESERRRAAAHNADD